MDNSGWELMYELKARITALEQDNVTERLDTLEETFQGSLAINDELDTLYHEAYDQLAGRIEELETREAGWERSFREVVDDYAKLNARLEELERRIDALEKEAKPQGEWVHGISGVAYPVDVTEARR